MRHRSPARWLAPVALVVCAVAAITVVQGSTSSSDGDSGSAVTTKTSKSKSGAGAKKGAAATKRKRTYTVKPGDVLGAIAEKNGTTAEELQALNPSLNPSSLTVGQKIRLPR